MVDELLYILEHWDELCWYDRKRIRWIRFRDKYGVGFKMVFSLMIGLSIIGVLIGEQHFYHMVGSLSLIVLFYFYVLLLEKFVISGGKSTEG